MNRLINEKSPYLLQHAQNPVDWHPWCREAFDKARKEDKPVFLSIGYSTCHWCHVMAHESFESDEVAAILNREYIAVKVDREERPDIDAVYMNVCQAITGSGGWPLTVILTPEQEPFFVGTYFPKNAAYGRPGLTDILEKTAFLWKTKKEVLLFSGTQIVKAALTGEEQRSGVPSRTLLQKAASVFWQTYDRQWGGFGQAPKFPTPHNLFFLIRYAVLEKNPHALAMVEHTMEAMAAGGIFDHIGGGFSRYSTDKQWLVPHFEKMLYDNALLAIAYLEAYQLTKSGFYRDVAKRTLDYMLKELSGQTGEFFCGQDADSDGIEGKYYYFTPDEVLGVLGQEKGKEFCRIYNITEEGNFEGKSIPNRIAGKQKFDRPDGKGRDGEWETVARSTEESRKKLYEYRKRRTRLHLDDKAVLSWNAWAIIAMARAGRILGEERYAQAAERAHNFIRKQMTDEKGRLFLRWRDGQAANTGNLDDYAVYGLALLELYEMTFETSYLKEAHLRAEQLQEFFADEEKGGYYLTASDAEKLIARPKETYDGAIPSGNSVAAVLLGRLARYTGEVKWQEASQRQNYFLAGTMEDFPYGHSLGLVALTEALYPAQELICVSSDARVPTPLEKYLSENMHFNLSVLFKTKENSMELADIAPYTKDYPVPQEGCCYYLCQDGSCKRPETDFLKLDLYKLEA